MRMHAKAFCCLFSSSVSIAGNAWRLTCAKRHRSRKSSTISIHSYRCVQYGCTYPFIPIGVCNMVVHTHSFLSVCAIWLYISIHSYRCVQYGCTYPFIPIGVCNMVVHIHSFLSVCAIWLYISIHSYRCVQYGCTYPFIHFGVCNMVVHIHSFLSVCAIWLLAFGICDVRTDVDAFDCARGLYTVRESALEVYSGRKIPCRTRD